MPWPWDDAPAQPDPSKQPLFDSDSLSPLVKRQIVRPYLPSPDEILEEQRRQTEDADKGILATILGLPEKVFFGQAIKGAVRGGAEGGFAGAMEGFARGTPFAFLWDFVNDAWGGEDVSRETSFSQIRTAFGEKDVEEGWTNAAINLFGEIALSPIELLAAPFALTKAGMKAGAVITSGETLAKALEMGHRAGMTLKVPWTSIALESNLGFKSGFILQAKMLDNVGKLVRTNRLTGAIGKVFEASWNLPTLDAGARVKYAQDAAVAGQRALLASSELAYNQLPLASRQIATNQGYGEALTVLHEFGVEKVDFAGSVEGGRRAFMNADVTLREAKRDALLKHNEVLSETWTRAMGGDTNAIRQIYTKHPNIPLMPQMLEAAGLEARVGVELTTVGAQTTRAQATDALIAQTPRDAVEGGPFRVGEGRDAARRDMPGGITNLTDGQAQRADISTEVKANYDATIMGARKKAADQYAQLMDDIRTGKISEADANLWLQFHKNQMVKQGTADIANGFMSESLEPFLGLYAPHIVSPEASKLIEDQLRTVLKKYDYAAPRDFRDMLAVEANAVLRDFGSKATGFLPTKQLKEEFEKKGHIAVLQRIFDMPFIRAVRKKDPNAAEALLAFHDEDTFFRIAPVENLFKRIEASGRKAALRTFAKAAFDEGSPLVEDIVTVGDFAKRSGEFGPDVTFVLETKSGEEALSRSEAWMEYGISKENAAEFEGLAFSARENLHQQVLAGGINAENALNDLHRSKLLHEDAAEDALKATEGELLASARMKGAVRDVQASKNAEREMREVLAFHNRSKSRRALQTENMFAQEAHRSLRAEWEAAINAEARGGKAVKASFDEFVEKKYRDAADELKWSRAKLEVHQKSIDSVLDEIEDESVRISGGYREQRKLVRAQGQETRANVNAAYVRTRDVVASLRSRGMDPNRVVLEAATQRRIRDEGALALEEAKTQIVGANPDGTPITLYDRIWKRLDPNTKIKVVKRENWDGYRGFVDDMRKPDPWRTHGLGRVMDRIKEGWAAHTVNGPFFAATRVRNLAQNMIQQMQAGLFSAGAQGESRKISNALRKMIEGDMSAFDALATQKMVGSDLTLRQVLDLAIENGAMNYAPAYAAEVSTALHAATRNTVKGAAKEALAFLKAKPGEAITDVMLPKIWKKGAGDSPMYRFGAQIESGLDQWQRLSAFMGGLKKGMTPEAAGQSVRKWLYDSTLPLTYTERTLFRRVMPFYSFQKYALRTSAEMFLTRPATITSFEKARKTFEESSGVEDIGTILPPMVAENYGIVMRKDKDGPKVRLFGSWFNVGEAAQVADAFDRQTRAHAGASMMESPIIRYVMNKAHPAIRGIVEQVANRNFISDRPLTEPGEELGEMFGVVMPKRAIRIAQQMRFLNELDKLNVFNMGEFKSIVDGVTRSATGEPEKGVLESFLGSAFSPLPAPGERAIRAQQEGNYRQAKAESALREVKGKMLRRIAQPDSMPAKQSSLKALGDEYRRVAAEVLRRQSALGEFDTLKTKADGQRLRRLQLQRLAGTGTARAE